MITCILVIYPDSYYEIGGEYSTKQVGYEIKKNIKYITSGRVGNVKIWLGLNLKWEKTINVSSSWVTAI
jgi:hypothetical protein